MYSVAYKNTFPLNSSLSNYVNKSHKLDFESTFEYTSIFLSLIGPPLLVIYFSLSSHIFLHFNAVYNSYSLETFTLLYNSVIISLAKLLFASSMFSGIGLMLTVIHENIIIFSFNLFCFLLSVGFYLPTLIMYMGD